MNRLACGFWKMWGLFFFLLVLIFYSVPFATATTANINGDCEINLSDAILALKICANISSGSPVIKDAEVNGDGTIGIEEVVYLLRALSEPALLNVSAPTGGDTLTAGTPFIITWQGSPIVHTVDILLSLDSGATYPYTLIAGTPNDGAYTWNPVPFHNPLQLSATCRIQVRDSANPIHVLDESDGLFSLIESGAPMYLDTLYAINETLKNDPDGFERDTDGDGLYDNVEFYLGTDPLHLDSDLDGLWDYWEVFGDVFYERPVPDVDEDGRIAALDNDDDGDWINDGRSKDSDDDGIPDYLEIYGFVYIPGTTYLYYPWDGDVTVSYYKTNPDQNSTDADQYSDSTEITGTNMDQTVKSPGDNPMIAAFPNLIVRMTGYTVTLNSEITETNGTVHEVGSTWDHSVQKSTSTTDEWHWEISQKVSASLTDAGVELGLSLGESYSETQTRGTSRSEGGQMSDATQWSRATCTNSVEAAQIKLTFEVRNVGTCVAKDVRITQNLLIGDRIVDTITHPRGTDTTIPLLTVNQAATWTYDLMITIEELRALRTGVPVTVEVSFVSAKVVKRVPGGYVDVNDWGLYFDAAKQVCAHLFLDLGDGTTTEQLVYAGKAGGAQTVTLRDALVWAANGKDTVEGPKVSFYRPDGVLGDPALLDGWYFSMDQATYDGISSYVQEPGFDLFDTVIKPGSLIVAKAPPVEPTPRIHWGELSPRLGKVTAYVDDYFFRDPDLLEVSFVDKYGVAHEMVWDRPDDPKYYSCTCPLNGDGSAYLKDGTERILARNSMFYNANDPRSPQYETEMPVSRMSYVPSFEHPYTPLSSFEPDLPVRDVFVRGNHAYVASGYGGLMVVDVNAASPNYLTAVGSCMAPSNADVDRVFVSGDFAYVTATSFDSNELYVVDLNPASPDYLTIAGSYTLPDAACGIEVSGSLAFIAIGESGLVIVDVSDPTNPVSKGACDTPGTAGDLFVSGGYAYIADGRNGLQIVDASNPGVPTIAGSYGPAAGSIDSSARGVFVSGNLAFVTGMGCGLLIIDVTDPQNPVFKGASSSEEFSYDVFVSGNFAFLAGEDGLRVLDVTNPENPAVAGSCAVSLSTRVFVSGDYAYLAGGDFGPNRLQVIDVNSASPDYLRIPGSIKTGAAHDLTVADGYVYLANYLHGLQIVDVSDPDDLAIAGSCSIPGEANEVVVSGGYAYVAGGRGGLQVVDVADPANPAIVGSCPTPGDAVGVFVSEGYAYVVDGSDGNQDGLQIVDVDPVSPDYLTIVGSCAIRYVRGVFVSGNYAYVISLSGLQVVDITNPELPSIEGTRATPGRAEGVFVSDGYAYVADGSDGLQIVDVDPVSPDYLTIVGSYDTPGNASDVYVLDGYVFVADSQSGLQVIDVSDPMRPTMVGACETAGNAWGVFGVFVLGEHAYMSDDFGLQVINFK